MLKMALAPADPTERGMHTVPGTSQEIPSRNVAPRVFAVLALVAVAVVVVALIAGSLGSSSSTTTPPTTAKHSSTKKAADPYVVVGAGDTLDSIASEEHVGLGRLERLNAGRVDPQNLQPGNCINVKPDGCKQLAAK
jgi:LysM repeat protein